MTTQSKILKSAAAVLLCIIFILLSIITALSATLRFCVLNEDFYREKVCSDEYLSDIHKYVLDDLKSECAYYGMSFEEVSRKLDIQKVDDLSTKYIMGLYAFMCNDESEITVVHYPAEDFFEPVHEYYASLGDINEEEDMVVAQKLADVVDNNINSMVHLKTISNLFKSEAANTVRSLPEYFLVFCAALLLVAAIYVFITAHHIQKALFKAFGILSLGAVFTFIPVWALKIFDLPSKIVLLDSPFKTLVDTIIYGAVDSMFTVLLIIFIFAFSGLLISSFFYAREHRDIYRRATADGKSNHGRNVDHSRSNFADESQAQENSENANALETGDSESECGHDESNLSE